MLRQLRQNRFIQRPQRRCFFLYKKSAQLLQRKIRLCFAPLPVDVIFLPCQTIQHPQSVEISQLQQPSALRRIKLQYTAKSFSRRNRNDIRIFGNLRPFFKAHAENPNHNNIPIAAFQQAANWHNIMHTPVYIILTVQLFPLK